MISLNCVVQSYDWGKKGSKSAVAKLKSSGCDDFHVNDEESYAELWMGTHPSGPARLYETDGLFLDWLSSRPSAVGRVPKNYKTNDLPFMFKVLSIKAALSIQAHPDKKLASVLHTKWPTIYRDSNHKPEMSIALTPFKAMCGFRPVQEIKNNLKRYPELSVIIGKEVCEQFESKADDGTKNCFSGVLRLLFTAYVECEESIASSQISLLIARLLIEKETITLLDEKSMNKRKVRENSLGCDGYHINTDDSFVRTLILNLNNDYPNDRGSLGPLLLNCLSLVEGEAFFMGPNEPHAYISGDCVEAMALSDNVVRVGLTPKFKDVESLCNMLHYGYGRPSSFIRPVPLDAYTLLYRPPPLACAEFEIEVCTIPANTDPYHPSVIDCGYMLLLFKGSDVMINEVCHHNSALKSLPVGSVLFISANCDVTIIPGNDTVVFYRCHINLGDCHLCPNGY